jgi:predicted DNA-binding transcriptional regulator YafY
MASVEAYVRVLELHQMLKTGLPVNATLVASHFEIGPRQATRTLEFLRDRLKAPLVYDVRRRSYAYSQPAFELPAAIMTEDEAIGIILAHQALLTQQPTPLGSALGTVFDKLRALFPPTVSVMGADLLQNVRFASQPTRLVAATLDLLSRAARESHSVQLEHYVAHRDETMPRVVDVYGLTQYDADWYAVGWCHTRRAMRTFAVSRIRKAVMQKTTFKRPPDFDIGAYFRDSMGVETGPVQDVVIEFDAYQARWIRERVRHPSQRLEPLPDGGLRVHLRVAVTTELRQWVLGYGAHAWVVSPASLARELQEEHRACLQRYGALLDPA